jgi:hypothetical protein
MYKYTPHCAVNIVQSLSNDLEVAVLHGRKLVDLLPQNHTVGKHDRYWA